MQQCRAGNNTIANRGLAGGHYSTKPGQFLAVASLLALRNKQYLNFSNPKEMSPILTPDTYARPSGFELASDSSECTCTVALSGGLIENLMYADDVTTICDVFKHEKTKVEFQLFLREAMAEENFLFVDAVQKYKQVTKLEREEAGKHIMETFVVHYSPCWVNLPFRIGKELQQTTLFTTATFFDAELEILELMEANFFNHFKRHLKRLHEVDRIAKLSSLTNHSPAQLAKLVTRLTTRFESTLSRISRSARQRQKTSPGKRVYRIRKEAPSSSKSVPARTKDDLNM